MKQASDSFQGLQNKRIASNVIAHKKCIIYFINCYLQNRNFRKSLPLWGAKLKKSPFWREQKVIVEFQIVRVEVKIFLNSVSGFFSKLVRMWAGVTLASSFKHLHEISQNN